MNTFQFRQKQKHTTRCQNRFPSEKNLLKLTIFTNAIRRFPKLILMLISANLFIFFYRLENKFYDYFPITLIVILILLLFRLKHTTEHIQ